MNAIYEVKANDFLNAGKISSELKKNLKDLGIEASKLRRVAVASYEAEINLVIHSLGGVVKVDLNDEGLLTLVFEDIGPGIPDLDKALTPGFSTASKEAREFGFGAGMGLPNIIRNADDYKIVTSSKGTTLTLYFNLL